MIASADGVANVEQAAHAAFQKQMPKEVDYAIEVAEKVIAHLIPAIKPNVQQIVRDIDIAALAPDYAGVINLIGGTVQTVKNDLASQYVGPLFDLLGNSAKLHSVIMDVRSALEAMDFNGRSFYAFLTDIFVTIQKGDGKTPAAVEGIFDALRNQVPASAGRVTLDPLRIILIPPIWSTCLTKFWIFGLRRSITSSARQLPPSFFVHLRLCLLAGSVNVVSGVATVPDQPVGYSSDGAVSLPNGKKLSSIARPIVNDLILGAPESDSVKQTPARFTQNLKGNAEGVVNLLFEFGVGDTDRRQHLCAGPVGRSMSPARSRSQSLAIISTASSRIRTYPPSALPIGRKCATCSTRPAASLRSSLQP